MSRVTADTSFAKAAAYVDNWADIADRLRWLDMRLRRQLLGQPHAHSADPLAPFKGLVITESEISELLERSNCGSRVNDNQSAELQNLERALNDLQEQIRRRRIAGREAGVYLSMPRLTELFGLSPLEEQCVTICLAPELDGKYEKLFAYLQDDATRRKPSVDFVLNLICTNQADKVAARSVFNPDAALVKCNLLQISETGADEPLPLLSRTLKLDDRIVNFLLDNRSIEARLQPFTRIVFPRERTLGIVAKHEVYRQANRFVETYFRQLPERNLVLYLHGPAGSDQRLIVEAVCSNLKLPLLVADVSAMKASGSSFEDLAWLLGREAALQSAVLCLENSDCLVSEPDKNLLELNALIQSAKTFSRLTFILGSRPWQLRHFTQECLFLSIATPRPDLAFGKSLWEHGLAAVDGIAEDVDSAVLAGKFRFGLGTIRQALDAAENQARWRSPEQWKITAFDLSAACRAHSSPKLGALVQKIEPRHAWNDIVLPRDNLAQLREICEQTRHRHRVYGEWGFDRKLSAGKGLNALFSGPPGTGKTMAAEVIAAELQLDLYRIDLSQVVSKYIGETEKNLHQIFLEMQTAHAILFFDEADALFGKRSEVKDAHDRYANIEVGYLLQKMDEYEGVAILATNLGKQIDEAFLRRMHFVTEFPFPDQEFRRQIWQVVFPPEVPLSAEVDFDVLARDIKLAGGNIKNIALAAAFYAAGSEQVIEMPHLWHAARREHQKLGRTWESHSEWSATR